MAYISDEGVRNKKVSGAFSFAVMSLLHILEVFL